MIEPLREVAAEGWRLAVYETGRCDLRGCEYLRYEFGPLDGEPLFEGADFATSPMHATDSLESMRALWDFLTLRPGDTDADYFEDYTPEQMEFAEGEAEGLSLYGMEDGPEFETDSGR